MHFKLILNFYHRNNFSKEGINSLENLRYKQSLENLWIMMQDISMESRGKKGMRQNWQHTIHKNQSA